MEAAAALSSSSYSSTAFLKSSVRVAPSHVRFPKRLRPIGPRAVAALRSVEQPQQRSFYELLGIDENVGLSDIKQAYRQMARKYHPDVCPRERAEEYTRRFMEVQEAYETLSDPRRKSLYDTHLSRGIRSGASANMRWDYPQEELVKEEWRSRWEVQLNNLKQKNCKNADQPLSWGARMRQQNSDT
uniref:J domain-containing protein n=1 Tax=Araucaria cunninghamii TaxID=56994 RepID=A0A0D6R4M4_ARACU